MGIVRFLKDWTLPVAIITGTAIYLIFAYVPVLYEASNFFAPICKTGLPVFMFLVLFVTFCKVDFHKLRPVRWHWCVGLFQILFVAITVGLILAFDMRGNNLILLEALLISIICPCASAAPVVTMKLGGNLEEMTSYTFLSNLITATLVPVCFPLINSEAHISFASAFFTILKEVFLVLLLPMFFAYLVKHYMHKFHKFVTGIKDLSYYLWACSLMIVSGTTIRNIVHADTSVTFLSVLAIFSLMLCIIQFAVGRYIGHFFGSTVNAGQALGQKNTVFAIWAATTYLHPLSTIGPGCYILWQNTINSFEIWQKRVLDARKGVAR